MENKNNQANNNRVNDKSARRRLRRAVKGVAGAVDLAMGAGAVAKEVAESAVDDAKRGFFNCLRIAAGRVVTGVIDALRAALHWLQTPHGTACACLAVTLAGVLWMLAGGDNADGVMCASVLVPGVAGGTHLGRAPMTTKLSEQVSPGLLKNEIDNRIVKIRPMATPIDQISRIAGSRLCGSMVVDYYSVDTKQVWTTLSAAHSEATGNGGEGNFATATLKVAGGSIFDVSETVLVPDVNVGDSDTPQSLVLYVNDVADDGSTITVVAVNNVNRSGRHVVPDLAAGTRLVRMGRAAAELDVQTGQFEASPRREQNFCQIFKAQVEQSTYMKIANKEVGWNFSDQEEAAIIDMRQGMEKNFIFGVRTRLERPGRHDDVLLTGGIWHQIGKEYRYGADGRLTPEDVVQLMRTAFTGQGASTRKLLIAGSGFVQALNDLQVNRIISAGESVTRWGLTFSELHSNFGVLYVLHSEMFDDCGHEDDAMVIDPEYLTKYCHVPFRAEKLNLRASGIRNTDAIVITEASCLVLRYPKAHVRVVRQK